MSLVLALSVVSCVVALSLAASLGGLLVELNPLNEVSQLANNSIGLKATISGVVVVDSIFVMVVGSDGVVSGSVFLFDPIGTIIGIGYGMVCAEGHGKGDAHG